MAVEWNYLRVDAALLLVLGCRCDDFLTGRMDARSLTAWTHSTVGHGFSDIAEPLAVLDDAFDDDSGLETSDRGNGEAADYARSVLVALNRPDLFGTQPS